MFAQRFYGFWVYKFMVFMLVYTVLALAFPISSFHQILWSFVSVMVEKEGG